MDGIPFVTTPFGGAFAAVVAPFIARLLIALSIENQWIGSSVRNRGPLVPNLPPYKLQADYPAPNSVMTAFTQLLAAVVVAGAIGLGATMIAAGLPSLAWLALDALAVLGSVLWVIRRSRANTRLTAVLLRDRLASRSSARGDERTF